MTRVALPGPFTALIACSEGAPEEAASFSMWSSLLAPSRATMIALSESTVAALTASASAAGVGRLDGGALLALYGERGRALAGRCAGPCSSLVFPPSGAPKRVLVAVGRPRQRSRTLATAAWIAERAGARLWGVHASPGDSGPTGTGAAVAANARAASVGVGRVAFQELFVVHDGDASGAILHAAARVDADLIVLGGRSSRRLGVSGGALLSASRATLRVLAPAVTLGSMVGWA
jgi:nucleotide-binding universal stress UspA family protein